jgi:hypothetical protein
MASYRIVTIASDGKLTRSRSFACDNDTDAIVWARQSVDNAPIELWSLGEWFASGHCLKMTLPMAAPFSNPNAC